MSCICSKCGKSFSKAQYCSQHELSCGLLRYECKFCGKLNRKKFNHTRHEKSCSHMMSELVDGSRQAEKRKSTGDGNTTAGKRKKTAVVQETIAYSAAGTAAVTPLQPPLLQATHPAQEVRVYSSLSNNETHHRGTGDILKDVKDRPYEEGTVEEDENLRHVVESYWGSIKTYFKCQKVVDLLNVRLWEPADDNFETNLLEKVEVAWSSFDCKAKVNASLGCLLEHKTRDEYRYFHSSSNNATLFEVARLISSLNELEEFVNEVSSMDLQEESVRRRPNTEWKLVAVTNVTFFFYKVLGMSRVGRPAKGRLPAHLLANRSVLTLDVDPHNGKPYNDHLCFFRCLSILQNCPCKIDQCMCKKVSERQAKQLKDHYLEQTGTLEKDFAGVSEEDLLKLEEIFSVKITVFQLKVDRKVDVIWCSKRKFDKKLNVNLCDGHFSYIRNVSTYSNSFTCVICQQCFDKSSNFNRHSCKVEKASVLTFPGGCFKSPSNIFTKLREAGIDIDDGNPLRYYPYRIAFDIEAMLCKEEMPANTKTTTYQNRHDLLSVSVCSNVSGFSKPVCFVKETTADECIDSVVKYLVEIAIEAEHQMNQRFSVVKQRLRAFIDNREKAEEKFSKSGFSNPNLYKKHARLNGLEDELAVYLRAVPVVGFNSQRYDINVIKGSLVKHLEEKDGKVKFVVKKNDSMTCIASPRLKFLDICNFIAPGFKYSDYLTAFNCSQKKGFFPYEWMDCLDKLDHDQLPEQNAFDSKLKGEAMTDENYKLMQQAWTKQGMRTIKDLLIWYNNLDVEPFLEAVEKQSSIYKSKGIDMLKEGLSLPGLAVIWMFATVGKTPSIRELFYQQPKNVDKFQRVRNAVLESTSVHLFDKNNEDLYQLFRSNTVGGPSQVFHRYHERGVTKIRPEVYGSKAKYCQEVLGVDANALYLYCIQGKMPVGRPRRRFEKDNFTIDRRDMNSRSAQGWLAWIEMTTGQKLETEYRGGERRLGRHNLPVDGFCQETSTVYQFHGCFWHGHSCTPSSSRDLRNKTADERLHDTLAKENYLKSLGYKVETIWQCTWSKQVSMDKSIKGFLKAFFDKTYGVDRPMLTMDILSSVRQGKLFGFIECDIKVPEQLVDRFTEMPPVFKNVELSRDHLSKHMRTFAEDNDHLLRPQRSLVASMRGDKILLFSELLKWYLDHGLVVTRVYQVVEYEGRNIFQTFGQSVSDARRAGDADSSLELLANTAKLVGNSLYGKTITDKTKHKNVNYFSDDHAASLAVRSKHFHSINPLDEGVYETVSFKSKIDMNVPVHIGFTILQKAKLRMLEYHYDCLDKFVDRSDYQCLNMDTDSSYKVLSDIFTRVIKPHKRLEFFSEYGDWFVVPYCEEHKKDFVECMMRGDEWEMDKCCKKAKAHDSRTPGKFKEEFRGAAMVALNSKTYFCCKDEEDLDKEFPEPKGGESEDDRKKRLQKKEKARQKYSSKGLSKKTNKLTFEDYLSVLLSGESLDGVNTGFVRKNNTTYTYRQRKRGLTYFYAKRKVLPDGLSTTHLDI